jgi:hypothetical protein
MFRAIAGVNLGSVMGEVTKRAGKSPKTLGTRRDFGEPTVSAFIY